MLLAIYISQYTSTFRVFDNALEVCWPCF